MQFDDVWMQDVEDGVSRIENRSIGFDAGWMSNNSLAWECYVHLLKKKGQGDGVPRAGKVRGGGA